LPHLDYGALGERLAGTPMVMVGHSDFTAIQLALHARSNLCTFTGPMLGPDFGAEHPSALTLDHFWDTVGAPRGRASWQASPGADLDIEGPLWGGNLAVLCSLIGTPYFPAIDGGILHVEDVGEPPFRIERLLYQLHLSGVLDRQRALVLGDFTRCHPGSYDNGYDLSAAFAQIRAVAGVPVIDGMPYGHGPDKLTLPFGVASRLRVEEGRASLDFSGYPHLPAMHPVGGRENA
jgi:muramoyltetrapeptide carboxypeptidase